MNSWQQNYVIIYYLSSGKVLKIFNKKFFFLQEILKFCLIL
jgi:hypothetical protein